MNSCERIESGRISELPFETAEYLAVGAWAANPQRYAGRLAKYFIQRPQRLELGYSGVGGGEGTSAVAREAISRITPFLSADLLQELEACCAGFVSTREREIPSEHGRTELLLLSAFGDALSQGGQERLTKLREQFPDQTTDPPQEFGFHEVKSPVPQEEAQAFSDEEWLEAMRAHPTGWDDADSDRMDMMKGSAVELSRVLRDVTRTDRPRFAGLVTKMGDSLNPIYFDAILGGLTRAEGKNKEELDRDEEDIASLDTAFFLDVIRRMDVLPHRPCGTEICRALRQIAERDVPHNDLRVVGYYATQAKDPETDTWLPQEDGNTPYDGGDPFTFGINTTRGVAAEAITRLIVRDRDRSLLFAPILETMCDDRVLGVRCCLFNALLAYRKWDRDQSVRLFLRACEGAELLFASEPYEQFLQYSTVTHYDPLRPVLQCGLNAKDPNVVKVAARQTALAGLGEGHRLAEARRDAAKVRHGTDAMRTAAAEVYAHNLNGPVVGHLCRKYLPAFFSDESAKVRSAAARCFFHLPNEIGKEYLNVIVSYVASPAFPNPHDGLLHKLEDSPIALPGEVALDLADRFIERVGDKAANIATASAGDSPTVAKLVFRQYAQACDSKTRKRCLDLIDRMERYRFYGLGAQLTEHDT